MFSIIKDLFKYISLFQKYLGNKIYIIFALSLFAAFSEGIGILMILPLLQSLDSLASLSSQKNIIADSMLSFMRFINIEPNRISILIIIGLFFTIKGLITFISLAINATLIGKLLQKIKKDLFTSYSNMSFSYYLKENTGYFTNMINDQSSRAIESFKQLTSLVGNMINACVLVGMAFFLTWIFGVFAIFLGILLLFIFSTLNGYVRDLSRYTANQNGILSNWLIQFLQGLKYLISTAQITSVKPKIDDSIELITNYQIKTGLAAAFTQSVREPIAVLFIISIVILQSIYLNQPLEPILVSIILFYRGLNGFLAVQASFQGTFQFIGSMEMIDRELGIQDSNKELDGQVSIDNFNSSVLFKSVNFGYDDSTLILNDLNIEFKSSQSTAIVGESGSGKTTILNLITLLNKPLSGDIFIDGQNTKNINKTSWRRNIGYVSQETVIFDDTIRNNISMWDESPNLDIRIKEACIKANLYDFVMTLPEGFNTLVGERGFRLSGGQRQRLFIARELFRNPKVLILDEATSSLDSKSEQEIQSSLDSLTGKITLVIIAHRLSTIRSADLIYFIENGRVVQSGSYDELMKNAKFSKLANMQAL